MTEINVISKDEVTFEEAYLTSKDPSLSDKLNDSLPETPSAKANSKAAKRKQQNAVNMQINLKPFVESSSSNSSIAAVEKPNHQNNTIEFKKHADVAQYKGSSYRNAVRVERGITLEKAMEIAKNDDQIDYFVYTKGYCMVLEIPPGTNFDPANDPLGLVTKTPFRYDNGALGYGGCRIFRHGDVVFFKNDGKWLGTAPGLADVYSKVTS